jgi:hypothetical protein
MDSARIKMGTALLKEIKQTQLMQQYAYVNFQK